MTTAIYPGSFDPLTNGHLSIIRSGLVAFDKLIVAVLNNPKKQALFSVEERIEMIRDSCQEARIENVEVDSFNGLLVDYAQHKGVNVILRGLRAISDFEFELQMASMNRHLAVGIETVFLMANVEFFYVASNLVKEVRALGGQIDQLVPTPVAKRLTQKLHGTGSPVPKH